MGYAVSWVAVKSPTEFSLLSALGFTTTDEIEEIPESPACYRRLPKGWHIVFSNEMEVFADDQLRELSKIGEVVSGAVEEHTMYSQAEYWVEGTRRFKAVHDSSRGLYHLEIQGELPGPLTEIPERLKAEQDRDKENPTGVDYMFEIPVELSAQLTGYRYNEGEDDEEWVVLESVGKKTGNSLRPGARSGCAISMLIILCLCVAA